MAKGQLNNIVDPQSGILRVSQGEFISNLFEIYCGSKAFRMLFDYDTYTENAIILNYPDNSKAFDTKLSKELSGKKFNGAGVAFGAGQKVSIKKLAGILIGIFVDNGADNVYYDDVANCVHYNDREGWMADLVGPDIVKLVKKCGYNFDDFQLRDSVIYLPKQ